MGNNRMHISPLASERQTKDVSGSFIGEARGFGRYLGQFRPNVMMADGNRVLYGLTAIEDEPLPESLPALTPRERMFDGNDVARAVSSVELAFAKIRPFEHGEHANNSLDGELIDIPAIHMGPISITGFEVLPGDDNCSYYTVSAGRVTCEEFFANTERMAFDVPAARLTPMLGIDDNDFVIFLAIPVKYGLGLPYDPMQEDRYDQVTLLPSPSDPFVGIGRTSLENVSTFTFLPRQTTEGYPQSGIIYIALAFVNGASIFQPGTPPNEITLMGHNYSVPIY